MCINSSAVLTANMIQLEQYSKEKNEKLHNMINAGIKKLQAEMKPNMKILKGEGFKVVDLNNVLVYILPASESADEPSIYTNKTVIIKRLGALEKKW